MITAVELQVFELLLSVGTCLNTTGRMKFLWRCLHRLLHPGIRGVTSGQYFLNLVRPQKMTVREPGTPGKNREREATSKQEEGVKRVGTKHHTVASQSSAVSEPYNESNCREDAFW